MTSVWGGDWRKRIGDRLKARGHETVTTYISAYPTATLLQLADELGEDVAPDQLRRMYRDEVGTDEAAFLRYARTTLVQRIIWLMPHGWDVESFPHAHVYGFWSTDVGDDYDDAVDRVFDALDASVPAGWVPSGPDDPLLLKAFERWAG